MRSSLGSAPVVLLLALVISGCSAEPVGEEMASADEEIVIAPERARAQAGDPTEGSTLRTTADLNLRAGPGTTFDILVTMPKGSTVVVTNAALENGFYAVKYASQTGWASAKYLERSGGGLPPGPGGPGEGTGPETKPPGAVTKVTIGGPAVRPHVQTFADTACSQIGCPHSVGTYGNHQPTADRAIDMMMAPGGTRPADGGAHGGKVAEFGIANAKAHRVEYVIWYQRINSNDGRGWRTMADRGSITQNHYDHVHVSFGP